VSGIHLQQKLFGKCTISQQTRYMPPMQTGNTALKIALPTTSYPKANQPQHIQQAAVLRTTLNVARATILEGSFGNEKNHYLLQKIRPK
jgi:hypothetical protein